MRKITARSRANNARERFLDAISRNTKDLSPTHLKSQILSCQPQGCTGAYAFKWAYLADEILAKYCDDSTDPVIRRDKAVEKMLASELICKTINEEGFRPFPNDSSILFRASQLIADVLGDITDYIDEISRHHSFTSGATTCRTRRFGDPYFKYDPTRSLDVTRSALPYAKLVIDSTPLWDQPIRICDGNVVFTVPKDCEIDRAACKEPALNQLLQTSVGNYIRRRLKLFGIDLNDQSRNRALACKGSKTGRFATIDLKSASDTISQRCVFELLPLSWVSLLDDFRSPSGLLPDGKVRVWEKHSTMGNGYTFELESLLFWALTRATIDMTRFSRNKRYYPRATHVSVYGDDIICPSHYFNEVARTLTSVGFTINEKKSFHTGSFRESCGGHFYNGLDVKPFYIRKPIDSPDRVIWLLNALRRWSSDSDGWCDPSVYQLWLQLRRKFVPSEFLGGRNLASTTEVVSPDEPRFSLSWVTPQRKIDGVRAVLRWFQFNPEREHLDSVRIRLSSREERYLDSQSPYSSRPVDWNHITDLGSRARLRVKRYVPSLMEISLFPSESVTSYHLIGS